MPLVVFLLLLLIATPALAESTASHALALHGEPKYGPGFEHFDYVNPNAPQGGFVRLYAIGTFDSLHPFILKGVSAAGTSNLYDSLTQSSNDEPFTEYGLIAETIDVADDHSWVAYTLRPEARFHDGSPITVADVIWTFETLKTDGHPFYRTYYADVASAEAVGDNQVKFHFATNDNPELPLIMGQMPVLPKDYWSERDFSATTLEPPLGSGPYRIASVDPGRSVTWAKLEDYWAADLPVSVGRNNFHTIRYDYYRDQTIALEAFKAGEYDFRSENTAKLWATGYEGPGIEQELIVKETIPHDIPTGMQAFVFNTRRNMFKDPRVRQALGYAFDFEWSNKTIAFDAYTRTDSFFSNSELAADGLPSPEELAILEPFRDQLPEEVFTEDYRPPVSDGSGNIRRQLGAALSLLKDAGWEVVDGTLTNTNTAEPLVFELLLISPAMERWALPFQQNLERLGVEMRVRTVDSAQYQERLDNFDFDMIVGSFGQSLSPGNEQRDYWGSEKADVPGSRNIIGVKDPVVDELIKGVISAPDRESLIHRVRALDRVLLWSHYVIPQFHIQAFRVAYWDIFDHPEVTPKYALGFDTWWVDPDRAEELYAIGLLSRPSR